MYLLEPPHVLGNVRCEGTDYNDLGYLVNTLSCILIFTICKNKAKVLSIVYFQVERRNKTIWETFDIDVTREKTSVVTEVTKTQG